MSLDRFYPIFDSSDWLERTLPLGVTLVQLRIKDTPEAELRAVMARAQALCRRHGAVLVDAADLPAIRRAGLKLGISTHDHAELDRAMSLSPDYVALGPVYPTILKKMKWQRQGLERVTEWKRLIGDLPLVAIGGMSVERAAGAFQAGADIVSAVTDITLHADPEARLRQWIEATR
jgi:thiamine-phosphate pyrophosphorylase